MPLLLNIFGEYFDPIMGMTVPTASTPGTEYALDITDALVNHVAPHKHTGSSHLDGNQLDATALNFTTDLSFNGTNANSLKTVRFVNQSGNLTGTLDVNELYVNGNNLGFNNSAGTFVPITSGNTLAIGTIALTNLSSRDVSNNFTIATGDTYNLVNINSTSNTVDGYLPIAASITPNAKNRIFIFKDVGNSSSTNNITIHVSNGSGNTFADSGGTTFVINNSGGYVGLYTDGVSKWFTFSQNVFNQGESVNFNNTSNLNVTNSFATFSGSAVSVQNTGTLTVQGLGSALEITGSAIQNMETGTSLNIKSGATIEAKSGSTVLIDSGSTTTMAGTTTISGTTTLSGTSTISGSGTINSTVAGGITSNFAGGIESLVNGGIVSGVAGGIVPFVAGGITSGTANGIRTTVPQGIQTTVQGGFSILWNTVTKQSFDSPYTMSTNDDYILINASGGAVTVKLLNPNVAGAGKLVWVIDAAYKSATNNITITTVGGGGAFYYGAATITSVVFATNGESSAFISDGTFWIPTL